MSVFGPSDGFGEGIVVHIPSMGWGIVDACETKSPGSYLKEVPQLEYLKKLEVSKLAFACLTHVHADHYRGFSPLLKYFREEGRSLERLWVTDAIGKTEYQEYLTRMKIVDPEQATEPISILGSIRDAKKVSSTNFRYVSAGHQLFYNNYSPPDGSDETYFVEVKALAPSSRDIDLCRERLWSHTSKNGEVLPPVHSEDYNSTSIALRLEYGNAIIILGGDVETGTTESRGWRGIVADKDLPELDTAAIKVPHHGAKSGFADEAWQQHTANGLPAAMLTPFTNGSVILPTEDDLKRLKKLVSAMAITARPKALPPTRYYSRMLRYFGMKHLKEWKTIENSGGFGQVRIRMNANGEITSLGCWGLAKVLN